VETVGAGIVDPPTTVIRVGIDQEIQVRSPKKPRPRNRRAGR
jgi:hypothetical protein